MQHYSGIIQVGIIRRLTENQAYIQIRGLKKCTKRSPRALDITCPINIEIGPPYPL